MATVGGVWNSVSYFLFKAWKWVFHLVSGTSEIERICKYPEIVTRTLLLIRSLRLSRYQELSQVTFDPQVTEQSAVDTIRRVKKLKSTSWWIPRLESSCRCVVELTALKNTVSGLRAERYSRDNESHEAQLTKLWDLMMPGSPLESRVTKQWTDIGFQGSDPATDFRGMGILSLMCMLYFVEEDPGAARRVLGHTHHPTLGYPYAITAINLTASIFELTTANQLDRQYIRMLVDGGGVVLFYKVFVAVLKEFDVFWRESEPANIMDFPRVKQQFMQRLQAELASTGLLTCMTDTNNKN